MIAPALRLLLSLPICSGPGPVPYDDAVQMPAELLTPEEGAPRRKLGAAVTLFVNFDGVEITECSTSDSHHDCSWINPGVTIPAWSGNAQARVGVLQAMRSIVRPYGIRVTGVRPPANEDYAMVVYGGTEEEFGSLGLAPAGDCYDQYPNQIAFAYMDGDRAGWVNGGAATAVHEAAHTWGLDHISEPYAVMAPAGDNSRTYFQTDCVPIVSDAEYTPGGESCPKLNQDFCGANSQQNDQALLRYLFGSPYVDRGDPKLTLVSPEDGAYFQGPADFDVKIAVDDELHPQVYDRRIWVEGLIPEPEDGHLAVDADFEVDELPIGSWTFHVSLRDEAGNEGTLSFEVEVGEDPPPPAEDEGCGCRAGVRETGAALWMLAPLAIRRRRRY
jgi:hypothetical protein